YSHALCLCPALRRARERLAALAMHDGDWDESRRQYQIIVEASPEDLDALLTLGTIQLHAGRFAAAIDTFQRGLLIEPEVRGDALDAVHELENDGQLEHAIGCMEKLVATYPGVTEFHVHLGDLYVKAAQDERAVAHYSVALELHPTLLEATVKLGTQ